MAIDYMWTSIAAWFTPSVLFCAANLIIATIFFASNSENNNKHHEQLSANSSRIARVSSFLDRARSMKFSSASTTTAFTTATITTTAAAVAEVQHKYPSQLKTANYSSSSRLAQSIYCSSNNVVLPELSTGDGMFPTESESEKQPLSQPVHAPSLFERVASIKFSSAFPAESEQISDSSPQLVRAPSFFDRVKSFRISSAFKSEAQPENFDNLEHHHVIRSKSDKPTKPAKKSVVEMKKSRSEMRMAADDDNEDVNLRRPATARESRNVADEEVDAKADDFISRFKQQLKLQRLESLVRYNEMLHRRN